MNVIAQESTFRDHPEWHVTVGKEVYSLPALVILRMQRSSWPSTSASRAGAKTTGSG